MGSRGGGRDADNGQTHVRSEIYRQSGVDTTEADAGLNRIIARVQKTWPRAGLGRLVLPIGYFANVIEVDGFGLALCTDGVGSKVIVAEQTGRFETVGIDCIAMNVNDVICVGAEPSSHRSRSRAARPRSLRTWSNISTSSAWQSARSISTR
ncbi:MAG: hypothetical protein DMG02_33860 [Acidobacteria bacterium]|nr:MAG: hypothetical protein DMG02_33860 [Acidobacteriota bacterium]